MQINASISWILSSEAKYYAPDILLSDRYDRVEQIPIDQTIEMSSLYYTSAADNTANAFRDKNLPTGCTKNNSINKLIKIEFC